MNIRIVDYLSLDSKRREEAKDLLKKNIFSYENELTEDEPIRTIAENIDLHYKKLEEKGKTKSSPYRSMVVLKNGVPVGTTFGHIISMNQTGELNKNTKNFLQLDFTAVKDIQANLLFISKYRRTIGSELGLRMFNWGRKFGCKEVLFLQPSKASTKGINWMLRNGWIKRNGKYNYSFNKFPKSAAIKLKPTPQSRIGVRGFRPQMVHAKPALGKRRW